MKNDNDYDEIDKTKQDQLLRLVTNSFYRELVNYGVNASDIVKVTVNLLDHVTSQQAENFSDNGYYNKLYKITDIDDYWLQKREIGLNGVLIRALDTQNIAKLCEWLHNSAIEQTFIRYLPKDEAKLRDYCLNQADRKYFAIYYQGDRYVGIIGAENINTEAKKLEMKKFVGDHSFQGKGIGKLATFLFLYYAFHILSFNKVYIHSLDTNIKNINLNSKFGFNLEGILYKEACINNTYRDVLRMGLLKNTWERIFLHNAE
ncbi:MAG TPA: N-acetyltransferase [Calditrichaeota bacterium]|nr:N-acetyltransferase [Calditrichota bacterium]